MPHFTPDLRKGNNGCKLIWRRGKAIWCFQKQEAAEEAVRVWMHCKQGDLMDEHNGDITPEMASLYFESKTAGKKSN